MSTDESNRANHISDDRHTGLAATHRPHGDVRSERCERERDRRQLRRRRPGEHANALSCAGAGATARLVERLAGLSETHTGYARDGAIVLAEDDAELAVTERIVRKRSTPDSDAGDIAAREACILGEYVGIAPETLIAAFAIVAYNLHGLHQWKARQALTPTEDDDDTDPFAGLTSAQPIALVQIPMAAPAVRCGPRGLPMFAMANAGSGDPASKMT